VGALLVAKRDSAETDPLFRPLPLTPDVLQFHHDEISELPTGATLLASSPMYAHQAFRVGNAWGVLFHPEADLALVEAWLAVPEMIDEAVAVLGNEGTHALPERAGELEAALIERTTPGFEAFAALVLAAAG
jgi:GMP synthase-like glutamine amidotransferase